MTREQIAEIISHTPREVMRVITTQSRPAEKSNTILVTEIEGKKWYCERPLYEWSPLDRSIMEKPYTREESLLYPDIKEPMGVFDVRGLWWAREEMSSIGLVPHFLKNPTLYLRMMARHSSNASKIVAALEEKKESLKRPAHSAENLELFTELFGMMYDSVASIFMTFDELAFQFRHLLFRYCTKEQVNTYFPQFLSGEATKAALELGYLEGEEGSEHTPSRGVLFAMHRAPHLFYARPKFFHAYQGDGDILAHLIDSGISDTDLERFLAFRTIVPVGFQINEESQYMETMVLSPHLGILMKTISQIIGLSIDELQNLSVEEIDARLVNIAPILRGIGASAGVAEGVVRVLKIESDLSAFQDGEILVTTMTDPTMVSAMIKASAIITDIGGLTSHPAILSREMGIPCVVNTKTATRALKSGMRVRVDGEKGEIYAVGQ